MLIRKANVYDAKPMYNLLLEGGKKGELLPRSLNEIYDNIRDFFIYEKDGELVAICALHICWEDLAEIRSLIVKDIYRKKGYGKSLLNICLNEARDFGIKKVFALTYQVDFFTKNKFKVTDKKELPNKIWSDCIKCTKFPDCDEVAVILDLEEN